MSNNHYIDEENQHDESEMLRFYAEYQSQEQQDPFELYHDEFIKWLYDTFNIWNGDRLIELEENTVNFENFIKDKHPEVAV